MRLLIAALALLALTGCEKPPPCLRSHTETYLMPMLVGKTTVLMPMTRKVCDERSKPDWHTTQEDR